MPTRAEVLLESLNNLGGPLSRTNRARLRAALLEPSLEHWEAAYGLLVTPRYTAWQAVLQVDPDFPTAVSAGRWNRFPDSFTLSRALQWAADQDSDASSHG